MKHLIMTLSSLLFAVSALAGDKPEVQSLSFENIKIACQNPARFHNQIAPSNIQVSCKDVQYKWVPDASGSYSMATARHITTSVISDKFSASPIMGAVQSAPQTAACPAFKEVAETVETVRAVTCDELVAFTGSAIEFCAGTSDSLRSANPQGVTSVDTGKVVNLCAGAYEDRGQRGQRGQH